jgi:hypothetical protein
MMKRSLGGLAAAVLVSSMLAGTATAAGTPSTVGIRIEGAGGTIVPPTTLTTSVSRAVKLGCSPTSLGGAIDQAVQGDWDGNNGFGMVVLERIRTETYSFSDYHGVSWTTYVKPPGAAWEFSNQGICEEELQQGEQAYVYAGCSGPGPTLPCYADPVILEAPATARPGEPFSVKVSELSVTFDNAAPYAAHTSTGASSGATVTGGAQPATTGADGSASVTVDQPGPVTLRATNGNHAPFTATVCVTDGHDGACGTTKPGDPAPTPAAPCVTNGHDGRCGMRDQDPPAIVIDGIRDGQTFRRARAPRQLHGTAGAPAAAARQAGASLSQDPSGILMVKLRLTRNDRGHCSYFSGRRERLRKVRCGARHGFWFKVGTKPEWSYLLPSKLPRGRYVLDVNAIDGAGNRADTRVRNVNRVVFRVR